MRFSPLMAARAWRESEDSTCEEGMGVRGGAGQGVHGGGEMGWREGKL